MVMSNDRQPLRPHAEHAYQAELAALRAVDDRPRPPHWQLSPWAVVTYLMGGCPGGRHRDLTEVRRLPPADRGSRGNPGHRSRAAPPRCAGYGKVLGVGAPGRGDLQRLDLDGAGHLWHGRRGHQVRLELCSAARRGAERAGAGSLAGDGGDGIVAPSLGSKS